MATQVEGIKWVPGTRFIVDGFAFQTPRCSNYFLTHMHSDHTVGLQRRWDGPAPIWCSALTARLLAADFRLAAPAGLVRALPLGQRVEVEGVGVTALCANHCPGAIMLLFEVPRPGGGADHVLHTGDCRWQEAMARAPPLCALPRLDTLMLDTTYASPRHDFPPQEAAIAALVQVLREELAREASTLVVVGSYHIGKERAYLGAAAALGLRVWAPPAKQRLLRLLDLPPEQAALLVGDPASAQLHVGELGLRHVALEEARRRGPWAAVIGVRPTGWSHRAGGAPPRVWREGRAALVSVPYSEHSSWSELRACVRALRPRRVVPTVNAATPAAARALVDRFADLMDLTGDPSRLDRYLLRPNPAPHHAPRAPAAVARAAAARDAPPAERGASGGGGGGGGAVACAAGAALRCEGIAGGEEEGGQAARRSGSGAPAAARAGEGDGGVEVGASAGRGGAGVGGPEGGVRDPTQGVDLAEQRRIWEECQRLHRLRRLAAAAPTGRSRSAAARGSPAAAAAPRPGVLGGGGGGTAPAPRRRQPGEGGKRARSAGEGAATDEDTRRCQRAAAPRCDGGGSSGSACTTSGPGQRSIREYLAHCG